MEKNNIDAKKKYSKKRLDTSNYEACWTEKDLLNNEIVDALVIILRGKGCSWYYKSGCTMCGYSINSSVTISQEDISAQFDKALEKFNNQKTIKIYTSGSFLDENEINKQSQKKIIEKSLIADKVIFESRPEYINIEYLEKLKNIHDGIEIAIGLESSNNNVLKHSINKGFTYEDFLKSAKILKKLNIPLKTYLLLKPPFLTENEAINDVINSISNISKYCETISINPVNIQKRTVIEKLWKKGEYSPPWLWSLVDIILKSSNITNARLMSQPTGVGKRGTHNCGICDSEVVDSILDFSLKKNINILKNLNCECKEKWLDQIDLEGISMNSIYDSS